MTVAIKNCELRDDSWEKLAVSVFPDGIYYDYATARAKARKAEETSDLQSDMEVTMRKIIPKRYSSSEDSGLDQTPRMSETPRMIQESTSLLPPPPKMRKPVIRSDETVSAPIQSPSTSYGNQEGSFSSMNIEIENIDAGPSGSTSIIEALAKINAKLSTLTNQMNVQRTIMLDVMQRMTALEKQKQPPPPPPVADQSFLSKFSYLQFPLASIEKLKELEEILKDSKNFEEAVNALLGRKDGLYVLISNKTSLGRSWDGL